ncbi:MAG: PD-(D/E)XK nuclease family protein [Ignavibacteria bacterium]|nr:PD-(D/E)XK nuclease family protein [Ignavibacteria bacterium]
MPLWTTSIPNSVLQPAVQAQTLTSRIAALPEGPLVIVVPTARQRSEVLVAWAQAHGRGEPPEILTMAGFIRAVGQQVLPDGPRIMPDASVDVLLRYAAYAAKTRPGAVRMQASRLARWAQEGLSPGLVRQLSGRVEGQRRRKHLQTVANVWFELLDLVGRRACDRGTYSGFVADEISRRSSFKLLRPSGAVVDRLLVLDTHGVTFVDRMLLHALCRCDWDVAIAFSPELPGVEEGASRRSRTDHMWFVSHGWISSTPTASIINVNSDSTLLQRSFSTRSEEVRRALALIKEALGRGTPLSEMAICVPGSSDYMRIIRELATSSGIPIDLDADISLASTRAASAVLSACTVIGGGWLRSDVERLLRDPFVRDAVPDVAHLLRVAREDRIVGGEGPNAWHQRCERKRSDAISFARADPDNAEEWEAKRTRYERAIRAISSLRSRLEVQAEHAMDAERFSSIIRQNIGNGLGIFDAAATYERVAVAALEESLSSYCAVAKDHRLPPVPFAEHTRVWWMLVQSVSVSSESGFSTGLSIVRPAELRGRKRKLVVVVGCIEGEFPRTSQDMLDEDLVPGLREAMAIESMADIVASVASDGMLLCTYPESLDGSMVLSSSLLDRVSTVSEPNEHWESLDPQRTILLDQRDLRIRSEFSPFIDDSQEGEVRVGLDEETAALFDEDVNRPMSPSRLDVVIQCPFKYHASKTLRLEDDGGENDTQMTSIERGILLHELVQRFYRSYQPNEELQFASAEELSAYCVDLRKAPFEDHWKRLCDLLDELLHEMRPDHLYAEVERRALVGTSMRVGLLRRWLANEIAYQQTTGFLPVLFEIEIDTEIDVPVDDVMQKMKVKTRIDRVDVAMVDSVLEFVVNDYKANLPGTATRPLIKAGKATQMPMYLAAVAAFFREKEIDARPAAAVYRMFGTALRSPEKSMYQVMLADESFPIPIRRSKKDPPPLPLAEQVEVIIQRISPAFIDLRSGAYPVRPSKEACTYCSYPALCRREHWGVIEQPIDQENAEQ